MKNQRFFSCVRLYLFGGGFWKEIPSVCSIWKFLVFTCFFSCSILLLSFVSFACFVDEVFVKFQTSLNFWNLENESEQNPKRANKRRTFGTFSHKSTETFLKIWQEEEEEVKYNSPVEWLARLSRPSRYIPASEWAGWGGGNMKKFKGLLFGVIGLITLGLTNVIENPDMHTIMLLLGINIGLHCTDALLEALS